ncbi:hypothetical protein BIV60_06735 [Bacillus sp. MUM 116]|nr:hypothetical protein BIV60_06735 [Bacillus sp. MUM 116]
MIVFGIYGTVAEVTHGLEASAYLVALIAMFFTAFSYTQMVKAYPVAGSAYTYTRKSLNSHLGFMVGWATLLDYVFIPMTIWLIGSAYLNAAFPSVPSWLWILLFIIVTTAINILGIKLSTKVNFLMMVFQFLVIALFIILSIKSVLGGGGAGTLLSVSPFVNTHVSFSFVLAGASIACYSFLGFDAISTFTEETRNPEKTIPRAIILTNVIGGLIFVVSTLPKKIFGYLHPKFKTPVLNILVVAVIGLLSLKLSVSTSTSFINFGAFVAFILVNVSVIAHFYIKGGKRAGKDKIFYLLFPVIGCCFDIWLFVNLDRNALILGGAWAVIGFGYLLVLTKMFKGQPPEMRFEEMDEAVLMIAMSGGLGNPSPSFIANGRILDGKELSNCPRAACGCGWK